MVNIGRPNQKPIVNRLAIGRGGLAWKAVRLSNGSTAWRLCENPVADPKYYDKSVGRYGRISYKLNERGRSIKRRHRGKKKCGSVKRKISLFRRSRKSRRSSRKTSKRTSRKKSKRTSRKKSRRTSKRSNHGLSTDQNVIRSNNLRKGSVMVGKNGKVYKLDRNSNGNYRWKLCRGRMVNGVWSSNKSGKRLSKMQKKRPLCSRWQGMGPQGGPQGGPIWLGQGPQGGPPGGPQGGPQGGPPGGPQGGPQGGPPGGPQKRGQKPQGRPVPVGVKSNNPLDDVFKKKYGNPTNILSGLNNVTLKGMFHMVVMYSSKYNKNIVLTGEKHVNNACSKNNVNVLNYDKYLYNLFKMCDCPIDFFVEIPYAKGDILFRGVNKSKGAMRQFNKTMELCFLQTKHCKDTFPYVRFHYADPRRDTLSSQLNMHFILDTKKDREGVYEDFKKALRSSKAYKQLEALDESMRNKILKHINDEFNTEFDKYENLIKSLDEQIDGVQKSLKNVLDTTPQSEQSALEPVIKQSKEIIKKLTDQKTASAPLYTTFVGAGIMNLYLLARMFKDYVSENVLIHAGDEHIRSYQSFLDKLGFKTLYDVQSSDTNIQCINVDINKFPSDHFFVKNLK